MKPKASIEHETFGLPFWKLDLHIMPLFVQIHKDKRYEEVEIFQSRFFRKLSAIFVERLWGIVIRELIFQCAKFQNFQKY